MHVAVAYCYPAIQQRRYWPAAERFVETWKQFPPGACDFSLHAIFNGRSPSAPEESLFARVNAQIRVHSNLGWDIGAFQMAAERIRCDLLVCLGAHCHFHRAGWLDRMVEAQLETGPALFGCRGYHYPAGSGHHIRTTCFWMLPEILQSYPSIVGNSRQSRYQFEHGLGSITEWVERSGFRCYVVTFNSIQGVETWDDAFGPVENCLVYDQWTHPEGRGLPLDRFP